MPERDIPCKIDTLPTALPISTSGYDITYILPYQQKSEDILDLTIEGPSTMLLKLMLYSFHETPNINTFLYINASMLEPPSPPNASIARTTSSFDEKVMLAMLVP
jgi:hypothetical protein